MTKRDEAKRELARRELARRRLVDYSEYVLPWYKAARHHRFVAEKLEQVERYIATGGEEGIGRLLIMEPPRHGKSNQVSEIFPTWLLGRLPDSRIILTSYALDLASKFSRTSRDLVMAERYRAVFGDLGTVDVPVAISGDSKSVQAWDLAAPHRGGMVAAGIEGGITGKGAHLLVIDDPLKNRDEAESEAHRKRVWEWYTSTAYTRLEKGGAVVVMLTRWHESDLAGELMRAMHEEPGADRWEIVMLPALAMEEDALGRKAGEALWPEKYPVQEIERIRANIGAYDFEALYQQQPYRRDGNMFKKEWLPIVDKGPSNDEVLYRIRVWDKAGSMSGKGDYVAGVLLCLTKDRLVYVEDVAREQCTPGERDELMKRKARQDRERFGQVQVWHQQDPGSAGLDSAMMTNRMLAAEGVYARYETVTGDKVVRAGPWASAAEGGMVRLVRGGWNQAFIDEHLAFPSGKYDDQVDSASWGYGRLMIKAGKKKEAKSYQG